MGRQSVDVYKEDLQICHGKKLCGGILKKLMDQLIFRFREIRSIDILASLLLGGVTLLSCGTQWLSILGGELVTPVAHGL